MNDSCKENICSICWDSIKDHDYTITKCKHTFCNSCLFKHMENSNECPCCRQKFAPEIKKQIIYKRRKLSFENFSKITGNILQNLSFDSEISNDFYEESYKPLINLINDQSNIDEINFKERLNNTITDLIQQYGIKLMAELEILDPPEDFIEQKEIQENIEFYRSMPDQPIDSEDSNDIVLTRQLTPSPDNFLSNT